MSTEDTGDETRIQSHDNGERGNSLAQSLSSCDGHLPPKKRMRYSSSERKPTPVLPHSSGERHQTYSGHGSTDSSHGSHGFEIGKLAKPSLTHRDYCDEQSQSLSLKRNHEEIEADTLKLDTRHEEERQLSQKLSKFIPVVSSLQIQPNIAEPNVDRNEERQVRSDGTSCLQLLQPDQREEGFTEINRDAFTEADVRVTSSWEGRQSTSVQQSDAASQDSASHVSTSQNYYAGPVSQYDLSNASNVTLSVGEQRTSGCITNDTLNTRIQRLRDVFVEVHALEKAKKLLKTHGHVTICGAPGDGKTSIALMLCEAYRRENFQVLFVENIEDLDIDVLKSNTNLFVIFDDIFGSVIFSCNLEKAHKLFRALTELVGNTYTNRGNKENGIPDAKSSRDKENKSFKFRVVFTSRSYNLKEGCSRLFAYNFNLFRPKTILDLTAEGLTDIEKEEMMSCFQKMNTKCDITTQDIKKLSGLDTNNFGFPLICKLFFSTPAFQMHTTDFFRHPLTFLRGDLDLIVREGSSRSAAIILLILCGGKLDLVSHQMGTERNIENMFQVVKEIISSCTKTDIRKEINNYSGTYCTVEQQTASFSHPSIHDAATCAFEKLNIVLLLQYCSLRFLYERVRVNKSKSVRSPEPDDVTNMIYIYQSLYPLVVSRLVEAIKQRNFSMTLNHPVLTDASIAARVLTELIEILPTLVQEKDIDTKRCFLHWASMSESVSVFEKTINIVQTSLEKTPKGLSTSISLSHSILDDLHEALVTCVENENFIFLHKIVAVLQKVTSFNVNFKTVENKTLLMIAAERCHLDVFKFLLEEGADATISGMKGMICLHFAAESGCKDIAKVILDRHPDLINIENCFKHTPAYMCAEMGHVDLLQFLVSRGVDLGVSDEWGQDCLHRACLRGYVSVVKYCLQNREKFDLDINKQDWLQNSTPVLNAVQEDHYNVYKLLVTEGADLSLTDEYNRDCLMLACEGGNMAIVTHLLSLKTFNINRKGGIYNQTPVMMAAKGGHYNVFNLLLSEGADLSLTIDLNSDCLMLACEGGNMAIVKHLLSLKTFNINRKDGNFNQTPVMMTAKRGHYDVFNLLVSEGADLSLTDDLNSDCLMLACTGGNMAIVKHLLSLKTFNINRKGGLYNQTPVMMAAKEGHYAVFNLLVSEGADLSLTDDLNKDCLMLACKRHSVPIVNYLLSLKTFSIN